MRLAFHVFRHLLGRCAYLTFASSGQLGTANNLPPAIKWLEKLLELNAAVNNSDNDNAAVVHYCYAPESHDAFKVLKEYCCDSRTGAFEDFIRARHLLGRLGDPKRLSTILVETCLENPQILENYTIEHCPSSDHKKYRFPSKSNADAILGRMLSDVAAIQQYRARLTEYSAIIDLDKALKDVCDIRARVHAEVILVDKIRSIPGFRFFHNDRYVGCSKPSCFCCWHYLNALPERFILNGCHQKIYVKWRPNDIVQADPTNSLALAQMRKQEKEREKATDRLIHVVREEVLRHIDEQPRRHQCHFDSVTGVSSTTHGKPLSAVNLGADGGSCPSPSSIDAMSDVEEPSFDFKELGRILDGDLDIPISNQIAAPSTPTGDVEALEPGNGVETDSRTHDEGDCIFDSSSDSEDGGVSLL